MGTAVEEPIEHTLKMLKDVLGSSAEPLQSSRLGKLIETAHETAEAAERAAAEWSVKAKELQGETVLRLVEAAERQEEVLRAQMDTVKSHVVGPLDRMLNDSLTDGTWSGSVSQETLQSTQANTNVGPTVSASSPRVP